MTGPLTEQAKRLADQVSGLSLAVDQLDRRTNRNAKVQTFVVFGLLLNLVLCVAVALVVANQFAVSSGLQTAIAREAKTRQEALCPLYALVVGGYNPSSRAAGTDRDTYNATFDVMRKGFDALDCNIKLVPAPASVQPPK